MKADFNNPIINVQYNGNSFVDYFGGPKPYGWVDNCSITLKLGSYIEFEVACTMPYNDALNMWAKFVSGSKRLAVGSDKISLRLGYYPNYMTPAFTGFITEFPEFTFAQQTTIVFKVKGAEKYLFSNNTPGDFKDQTYLEIILSVCEDEKIEVLTYPDGNGFEDIRKYVMENMQMNDGDMKMIVSSGAYDKLNTDADDMIKNDNSWSFLRTIFDNVGLQFCLMGAKIIVFDPIEAMNVPPNTFFKFFGNFDIDQRHIPITDARIDPLPSTYTGGGTSWRDTSTDETKSGSGKVVDSGTVNPKNGVPSGTKQVLDADNVIADSKKTDRIMVSGSSGDANAKAISQGNTVTTSLIAVKMDIDTIGLPDVIPGDVVRMEFGRTELDMNWQILTMKHTWDGGFKSNFELLMSGNVDATPNTQHEPVTNDIAVTSSKEGVTGH